MNQKFKAGMLSALLGGMLLPIAAEAAEGKHKLELKGRGVYWQDESRNYPTATVPNPRPSSYEQSALGLEVNYLSPYWGGVIGVDAGIHGVVKLGDSGPPITNLLEVGNNGQLHDSYGTVGVAALKLKHGELAQARIGRQLQNSLLLKSTTTRAVPDTYSGLTAAVKPLAGLSVHGAVYDRWRTRSSPDFEKFRTESTAPGVANAIDYIGILGATYARGPVAVTAEYLHSKDYLSKFGLVGAYTIPYDRKTLKLSAGLFTTRDAGHLFVCGAEKEMDCAGTGRLDNDGLGVYLDAEWKAGNFTVGGALAKFDGFWVEDNFAVNAARNGSLTQDHGTSVFPTSAGLGPDLTNNGESVGSVRLAYDWKDHVSGLKTAFKYSRGTGAKSSNLANSARGAENYREFDLLYAMPFLKGLGLRYLYMDYDSKIENGSTAATIKGLAKQDWEQHRVYVDYVYQF